jgi:hypothetical protein
MRLHAFATTLLLAMSLSMSAFAINAVVIKKDGTKVKLQNFGLRDTGCWKDVARTEIKVYEKLKDQIQVTGNTVDIAFSTIKAIKIVKAFFNLKAKKNTAYKIKVILLNGLKRPGFIGNRCSEGGHSSSLTVTGNSKFGEEKIKLDDIAKIRFKH